MAEKVTTLFDHLDPHVRDVALIAEVGMVALQEIALLLDNDCDATGIALYNPRNTVTAIRKVLAKASDQLAPGRFAR